MALRDETKEIVEIFERLSPTLETNFILLDIFEGNLLPYILDDLKIQLNRRAFEISKNRVPPINILKRVVDKLSQIYNIPPQRYLENETPEDEKIWEFYNSNLELDVSMSRAEEYFNLNKAVALEPYLDSNFLPKVRPIPYDRFFVIATDPTDPMRMTRFVKIMGKTKVTVNGVAEDRLIMFVYSDEEFLIMDSKGEVREEMMLAKGLDGTNPYKKIPFVYINKSYTRINPPEDTDILRMTKLIPILMTDLNYALMFQTFSIIYGIDVDFEKLEANPNVFWSLKSDPTKTTQPKVDIIKPEVDSDKALTAIHEQLALWLQSRNISPGSSAKMGVENMASGVSKMVDQMDTTNERQKTIPYFECAEESLFELIKNNLHPFWTTNPSFEVKNQFSANVELDVDFPLQQVMPSRGEVLAELKQEIDLNLVSQKSAMIRLNPDFSPEQIDAEILAIDAERTVEIQDISVPEDDNGNQTPEIQPQS